LIVKKSVVCNKIVIGKVIDAKTVEGLCVDDVMGQLIVFCFTEIDATLVVIMYMVVVDFII
jgi:hypothetical protein